MTEAAALRPRAAIVPLANALLLDTETMSPRLNTDERLASFRDKPEYDRLKALLADDPTADLPDAYALEHAGDDFSDEELKEALVSPGPLVSSPFPQSFHRSEHDVFRRRRGPNGNRRFAGRFARPLHGGRGPHRDHAGRARAGKFLSTAAASCAVSPGTGRPFLPTATAPGINHCASNSTSRSHRAWPAAF